MSKRDQTTASDAPLELMDQAQRFLNEGQLTQAIGIFRALKDDKSFERRYYAWQQYAIAQVRAGQYDQALNELTKLEKDPEIRKPARSHFRAITLRLMADIAIMLGQDSKAQGWLDEAQTIFEETLDNYQLAFVLQDKATLLVSKDPQAAMEKLQRGLEMETTYRVPTSSAIAEPRNITRPLVPTSSQ
jgi:tetratricopeptide (TPR) repeat protein